MNLSFDTFGQLAQTRCQKSTRSETTNYTPENNTLTVNSPGFSGKDRQGTLKTISSDIGTSYHSDSLSSDDLTPPPLSTRPRQQVSVLRVAMHTGTLNGSLYNPPFH